MKKTIYLFGLLLMSLVILQSCGGPDCDCEEIEFNKKQNKWMTIETSDNPVSVIFDGLCESTYDDGSIKKAIEFKIGLHTGDWFENYPDGKIKFEKKFINGYITEVRKWSENNTLVFEELYNQNGDSEPKRYYFTEFDSYIYTAKGETISKKEWFDNGMKSYELDSTGLVIEWNESGQLVKISDNNGLFSIDGRDLEQSWGNYTGNYTDWKTQKIEAIIFDKNGYILELDSRMFGFFRNPENRKDGLNINEKNDLMKFLEAYMKTKYEIWTGTYTITKKTSDLRRITPAQKEEINKLSEELKKLNP